jgi:hypothetical protein
LRPPDELVALELASFSSTTRVRSTCFRPWSSASEAASEPLSARPKDGASDGSDVPSVVNVRMVPY